MKINLTVILAIVLIAGIQKTNAQDSSMLKTRVYRIIAIDTGKQHPSGWLANISDSAIHISSGPIKFAQSATEPVSIRDVNYQLLEVIKLKRINGAGRGFGTGFVVGFLTGAIIGLASNDNSGIIHFSAGERALGGGLALGIVSGAIGTVIGALAKKTFKISRSKEKFDWFRVSVINKTYRSN